MKNTHTTGNDNTSFESIDYGFYYHKAREERAMAVRDLFAGFEWPGLMPILGFSRKNDPCTDC